jgi:hypothetical protein
MSKARELESTRPGQSFMRLRSQRLPESSQPAEQPDAQDPDAAAATVRSVGAPELPDGTLRMLEKQCSDLLEASAKNAAGLQALQRAFKYAAKGLGSAAEAHERMAAQVQGLLELVETLRVERDSLQELVSAYIEEQQALNEAARSDRERLLEEQDRFIQLLLEEHEQALSAVKRDCANDETDDDQAMQA